MIHKILRLSPLWFPHPILGRFGLWWSWGIYPGPFSGNAPLWKYSKWRHSPQIRWGKKLGSFPRGGKHWVKNPILGVFKYVHCNILKQINSNKYLAFTTTQALNWTRQLKPRPHVTARVWKIRTPPCMRFT